VLLQHHVAVRSGFTKHSSLTSGDIANDWSGAARNAASVRAACTESFSTA
jgi:hypothetical protein